MLELESIITRLRSQVSRAEPVLFIGAGFSLEAQDAFGQKLLSSRGLATEFWNLAFPSEAFDSRARLGDVFYSAKAKNRRTLSEFIQRRLSVDSGTLEEFYRLWFSVPWARCYTLNIDDLELAVVRRFHLPRRIHSVSATSGKEQDPKSLADLEVVHLNGAVWDDVDNLTFSPLDYAGRQTTPEHWLVRCANDVMTRPVVFVGTELDEPTLWQYLEFRKTKGGRGLRELRPASLLICPSLDAARRLLLRELNVDWLPMTAREFAEQILEQLSVAISAGTTALLQRDSAEQRLTIPSLVSELASLNPDRKTEYLLGEEPDWSDLHAGRAIERECDKAIFLLAKDILSSNEPERPLLITGTAGSGKSTSLMRLGLKLSAESIPTYWIDERSNFEHHRLRQLILAGDGPIAILVDDADLFGRTTTAWARELPSLRSKVLVAFGVRSTKVDGFLDKDTLGGIEPKEISIPHLTDPDIQDLIHVLDRENRLGVLKGKSNEERVAAFREEAGRQLLVAMIQATSGQNFREKAVGEFTDLSGRQRLIYAILSFVHSQRYSMNLDELLTAINSRDNETLNDVERMVSRNLIVRDDRHLRYETRHRVIAEQVVNSSEFRSNTRLLFEGVCFAFASHIGPSEPRNSRPWRRLIRFINHEFILNNCAAEDGRAVYGALEGLLSWNYHYWLQRGALEVQEGDLSLATNFLGQAQSLAPEDPLVENEWAYLVMKKASRMPKHTDAKDWFAQGYSILARLVEERGHLDPHHYHVLGRQTLAWIHAASLDTIEKRILLRQTLEIVKSGTKKHPRNDSLLLLAKDVEQEWLMTTVS